jgi:hypothetical protein
MNRPQWRLLDLMRLEEVYGYHPPPNRAVREAHEAVREACQALAEQIDGLVPICAEKVEALRLCQEAMFWANAGVARNHHAYQDEWMA